MTHGAPHRAIVRRERVNQRDIEVDQTHPFSSYINVLGRDEQEVASFDAKAAFQKNKFVEDSIRIIAKSRIGHLIAWEVPVDPGRVIFLPEVNVHNLKSETGLLLDCIHGSLGVGGNFEPPSWVDSERLPGESKHEGVIKEKEDKIEELEKEKKKLQKEQSEIRSYKKLLYSKGKFILEPQVVKALELFGFTVDNKPVDEKVDEEFDGVIYSEGLDRGAVVEVEGRNNKAIKLDKYTQLLHKVDQAERMSEKDFTGILVGNAYRNSQPENRAEQFTQKALEGCENNDYTAITTVETYEAVKEILDRSEDEVEGLKREIRKELVNSSGLATLTDLF